ncbi:MAG TPA: response regulator [Ktedonobacteraceae bacterium]|jgi:DNA-binding response OmpR family regulator|nr:response regulator [Ktedonobacteraceae bacterium]
MQDRDAASSSPGGGQLNSLNKATSNDVRVFDHPMHSQAAVSRHSHKILVVEDDTSLASLEANFLTASGYATEIASNGELAIVALQQAIPDLVLLDLDLAGSISGWEVLKVLRTYSSTPVLLTSSAPAVRQHIRSHGESRATLDHLPKPYPMHTLLKRIERMLTIGP